MLNWKIRVGFRGRLGTARTTLKNLTIVASKDLSLGPSLYSFIKSIHCKELPLLHISIVERVIDL